MRRERRIYFGTDNDNQRNSEIFKIARDNDMQVIQGRENPFNSDRQGLAI